MPKLNKRKSHMKRMNQIRHSKKVTIDTVAPTEIDQVETNYKTVISSERTVIDTLEDRSASTKYNRGLDFSDRHKRRKIQKNKEMAKGSDSILRFFKLIQNKAEMEKIEEPLSNLDRELTPTINASSEQQQNGNL